MASPHASSLMSSTPDAPPSAALYQRHRLWAGVWGIGSVLGLLWFCVLGGLADGLATAFGSLGAAFTGGMTALTVGILVSFVQLPFDYYAGRVVEGKFRQVDVNTPYAWTVQYGKGIVEWLVMLAISGAVVGGVWHASPERWPILAGGALVGLSLVWYVLPFPPGPRTRPGVGRRVWLEQLRGELDRRKLSLPALGFYEHGEKSLAGGWSGVGRLRTLWVASTIWEVEPRTAAALLSREITHLKDGHRALSLMATAVWSLAGLVLSSVALRFVEGPSAADVVLVTGAVMSTWCWIGLLCVWPAVGRWQVLAADKGMLVSGFTVEESLGALAALSERNKPDETLPSWLAYVFHPIPPMSVRRAELRLAAK